MSGKEEPTRKAKVLELMMDGEWHKTMDICAVTVGGSEGTRRLREIRAMVRAGKIPGVLRVQRRKCKEGTQYEYRLLKIVRTPKPAGWRKGDELPAIRTTTRDAGLPGPSRQDQEVPGGTGAEN